MSAFQNLKPTQTKDIDFMYKHKDVKDDKDIKIWWKKKTISSLYVES